MPDCIFCDIVSGKAPSYTVFENSHAKAFLDLMPAAHGHVLVVPKMHAATLDLLPEESAKETIAVVQKIARAIMKTTTAKGYNVLQSNNAVAGQVVFHVHFHIIPRKEGDALSFRWERGELNREKGLELQGNLRRALIKL